MPTMESASRDKYKVYIIVYVTIVGPLSLCLLCAIQVRKIYRCSIKAKAWSWIVMDSVSWSQLEPHFCKPIISVRKAR